MASFILLIIQFVFGYCSHAMLRAETQSHEEREETLTTINLLG
jgi:hypothetical protein